MNDEIHRDASLISDGEGNENGPDGGDDIATSDRRENFSDRLQRGGIGVNMLIFQRNPFGVGCQIMLSCEYILLCSQRAPIDPIKRNSTIIPGDVCYAF